MILHLIQGAHGQIRTPASAFTGCIFLFHSDFASLRLKYCLCARIYRRSKSYCKKTRNRTAMAVKYILIGRRVGTGTDSAIHLQVHYHSAISCSSRSGTRLQSSSTCPIERLHPWSRLLLQTDVCIQERPTSGSNLRRSNKLRRHFRVHRAR